MPGPTPAMRISTMDRWLAAALDYIPRWLDFQMQVSQQPGCIIAIAHRGNVVLERAFGTANLDTGEALTPRHRFRVASHSKSFTAAGIMKLREQRRLKLDDAAGDYVEGLHRDVARATIAQLLSHTAGIIRDGEDAGQFLDRRPYLNEARAARRAQAAARHRARHAHEILQPRLRPARLDHQGDHRRAVRQVDQARDRRRRRAEGNDARHAAQARHAVRARPHRTHPARPPPRHSGRQPVQRDRRGGRLRQHGRRHRALFRAARA